MYAWRVQREYLEQPRLIFELLLPQREPIRFIALAFPVRDVIKINLDISHSANEALADSRGGLGPKSINRDPQAAVSFPAELQGVVLATRTRQTHDHVAFVNCLLDHQHQYSTFGLCDAFTVARINSTANTPSLKA